MAKAYVKHDYVVTGRDYVETEGGDTPAGGVSYSTEEQDTGLTWIDGRKIYQITVDLESVLTISPDSFADTPLSNSGLALIIDAKAINSTGSLFPVAANRDAVSGYVQLGNMRAYNANTDVKTFTIWYVKTE